jgi:hypothetical protein
LPQRESGLNGQSNQGKNFEEIGFCIAIEVFDSCIFLSSQEHPKGSGSYGKSA